MPLISAGSWDTTHDYWELGSHYSVPEVGMALARNGSWDRTHALMALLR